VVREKSGFKQLINDKRKATNAPTSIDLPNIEYIDIFCSTRRNQYNAKALTIIIAMTKSLTFRALINKFR